MSKIVDVEIQLSRMALDREGMNFDTIAKQFNARHKKMAARKPWSKVFSEMKVGESIILPIKEASKFASNSTCHGLGLIKRRKISSTHSRCWRLK